MQISVRQFQIFLTGMVLGEDKPLVLNGTRSLHFGRKRQCNTKGAHALKVADGKWAGWMAVLTVGILLLFSVFVKGKKETN